MIHSQRRLCYEAAYTTVLLQRTRLVVEINGEVSTYWLAVFSTVLTFWMILSSFPLSKLLRSFWGGPRGVAVGWGTAIQALRSRVRFPMVSLGIFHWNNPSGRTMALGLNQPLTEMSTRNIPWWVKVAGAWADSLTTFMCRLSWNIGVSTSWNPQGLSRPEMGDLYLLPLPLSFTLPHSSCFHLLTSQLQGRI